MYLLDVAYPIPDVVKGLLVGDVVHQHDALRRRQEVTSPAQEATHADFEKLRLTMAPL